MEQTTIDFKALNQEMQQGLKRINRLRRLVRCLICILYPVVLLWFVFCLFGGYLFDHSNYETSAAVSQYIMIGFVVFCLLHYIFMKSLMALNQQETQVMNGIILKMFPSAQYTPSGSIDLKTIAGSRLFSTASASAASLNATGYGRVDIPMGDRCMSIADLGISSNSRNEPSTWNSFHILYQSLVRPIFGTRIESTMHSFRGMFGYCKTQREFKGYVMLLPDHLENKVGYLAQTIQRFKQKNGAKFVHLEDPEFENLFAVYADDEVEARMVLTPAMMRRMTELRKSFRRDLMLSFNGDTFYYASDTPDGFLRPGRKSLNNESLLEQLYREIDFCRTIETSLTTKHP
jgi:hypothetical protein